MLTAVTNRRKSGTKPLNQDGEQLRSSLMSFINHRERRPIVRRPPGFICKSFVDALPAANKQRSGRWSALPPHPPMPFTCMGTRPHGPRPGWRLRWWRGGRCWHLPQRGTLMLMDSRRSPDWIGYFSLNSAINVSLMHCPTARRRRGPPAAACWWMLQAAALHTHSRWMEACECASILHSNWHRIIHDMDTFRV